MYNMWKRFILITKFVYAFQKPICTTYSWATWSGGFNDIHVSKYSVKNGTRSKFPVYDRFQHDLSPVQLNMRGGGPSPTFSTFFELRLLGIRRPKLETGSRPGLGDADSCHQNVFTGSELQDDALPISTTWLWPSIIVIGYWLHIYSDTWTSDTESPPSCPVFTTETHFLGSTADVPRFCDRLKSEQFSNKLCWHCYALRMHVTSTAAVLSRRLAMDDAALTEAISMFGSCSIQDGREDHIPENAVANKLPIDIWTVIFSRFTRLGCTLDLMAAASVCRHWRWVGSKMLR